MYPTGCVPPKFYGLPKIHKPDTPLRPIVSSLWVCHLWCGQGAYQNSQTIGWQVPTPHHQHPRLCGTSQADQTGTWRMSQFLWCVCLVHLSPNRSCPQTSSRIYWIRTLPSRKELLWKLETLSSYWRFVSKTPTFLSKTSSMNRSRVLPWVPQSSPLWPIYTWST